MITQQRRPSAERWADHTRSIDLALPGAGDLTVRVADRDRTRPYLLLHGGAGPGSVAAFGDLLAARNSARVLTPTLPGFDGTARPAGLTTMGDLARLHVALLEELDVSDVTVIGNSLGGWLALEIGLLGSTRVSGVVVLDAVGADLADDPIADVRTLDAAELVARSFADPARAAGGGAGRPTPEQVRANLSALYTYGGESMSDPTLLGRVRELDLPVQIIWGAADRIAPVAHAHALAGAIPEARLDIVPDAGHLPQLEAAEAVLGCLNDLGGDPR